MKIERERAHVERERDKVSNIERSRMLEKEIALSRQRERDREAQILLLSVLENEYLDKDRENIENEKQEKQSIKSRKDDQLYSLLSSIQSSLNDETEINKVQQEADQRRQLDLESKVQDLAVAKNEIDTLKNNISKLNLSLKNSQVNVDTISGEFDIIVYDMEQKWSKER